MPVSAMAGVFLILKIEFILVWEAARAFAGNPQEYTMPNSRLHSTSFIQTTTVAYMFMVDSTAVTCFRQSLLK